MQEVLTGLLCPHLDQDCAPRPCPPAKAFPIGAKGEAAVGEFCTIKRPKHPWDRKDGCVLSVKTASKPLDPGRQGAVGGGHPEHSPLVSRKRTWV